MSLRVRANVLQRLSHYVPGKPIEELRRELGLDRIVKLASNESPFGPSPLAVRAAQEAAETMHLYPDAASFELRMAIAEHHQVDPSQVMLGNGSDDLIHLLGLVFLSEPADELLTVDPSFVRYDAAAGLADCMIRKVPVRPDYGTDVEALAAAIGERTKLVFLANPNNPTGVVTTAAEVDALLAGMPSGVPLVLDEAYYEFAAGAEDFPDGVALLRGGAPVVVLRTFSKAYGLAGLRIGYGLADAVLVDAVDRAREPYNVNRLAQSAAIAALGDVEHVRKTVENNRAGLERLAGMAERFGARFIPSAANFAALDFGRPTTALFQALLEKGVIVRAGAPLGMPTCLRVSIGLPDEMDALEKALAEVLSPVG